MTHKYLIVYLQCHHPPCFFNLCNPFHFPPWQHWSRLAALDIPWICLPHNFEALRRPGDAVSPRSPRGYLRWAMERKEMENMGGIGFLLALLLMAVEMSQSIWGWYCIPWRQFEFRSFQQFWNYHLRLQNHDRFNITNIQQKIKKVTKLSVVSVLKTVHFMGSYWSPPWWVFQLQDRNSHARNVEVAAAKRPFLGTKMMRSNHLSFIFQE